MAAVWGRAEIIVTADGSLMPAQVQRITARAGDEAGETFAKRFGRALNQNLPQTIRRFTDSLRGFTRRIGNSTPMLRFRRGLMRIGDAFRGMSREVQVSQRALEDHDSLWKRLSYNTRQWTLIIGAAIAGMQQIATLGSAAGVGLIVLGGAITSAVIGMGTLVTVFSNFAGDVEKLPAAVRPAARAFQSLGDVFKELRDNLQVDALADTEDAWRSIGDTIRGLKPAFKPVTKAINNLVKDLAKNLKPGTKQFQALSKLIENAGPNFEDMTRTAGRLGYALTVAFNKANPLIQKFLGWVDDLVTDFTEFAESDAFDEWLGRAERVFHSLDGLLDAIGSSLDDLVTDESTKRLTDFIDNIAKFVEGPGTDLMDFFGRLDIFGLIAEALIEIGDALEPLAEPMDGLADALNDIVSIAIDTFADSLATLVEPIAGIAQGVKDFMDANPEVAKAAMEGIGTALGSIAAALVLFKLGKWVGFIAGATSFAKIKGLAKNVGILAGLALAIDQLGAALDENQDMNPGLSALSGALLGMKFGPVGALVGTLAGLVSSMIDDVFGSPDVKGSWQNGWDQIFDPNNYTGAGIGELKLWFQQNLMGPDPNIPESGGGWLDQVVTGWSNTLETWKVEVPNFFRDVGAAFANGWEQIMSFFDTTFVKPLQNGWNQIVSFFTVSVPGFFQSAGQWFQAGWAGLMLWFDTTFVQPIKTAWIGFVNFWTVEVPRWFNNLWSQFQAGLARLTAPFTSFFADVKRNWDNFWSGLGSIVSNTWNTIATVVRDNVNKVIGFINSMISGINRGLAAINSISGGLLNLKLPTIPRMASGGVLTGPRRILAGEAGPEAIVPLSRPLSQVDPSVRWLSAIAQGINPGPAGGGGGPSVVITDGGIVITEAGDPARSANEVVNRLFERIAG